MSTMSTKLAVVTGASRGIGRAIAIELAARGAHVVMGGRDRDALEETVRQVKAAGGSGEVHALDVASADSIAVFAEAVLDRGAPETLVNNSGIAGPVGNLWEIDQEGWQEAFRVNVEGAFLCAKAFLPAMISRGSGSIVNIGSATGKAALPGRTAYAATKLALVGMTRTLAVEVGPYGVRVNLVSPANVDGDRLRWVLTSRAKTENTPIADIEARMTSQAALKRFVSAEEVAKTVAFLASDDATGVTGEDINVSAGYVMY
jgi:NAD(P)-dependent dehydrogenase (short-subunit alcohol dehydrogenase family)